MVRCCVTRSRPPPDISRLESWHTYRICILSDIAPPLEYAGVWKGNQKVIKELEQGCSQHTTNGIVRAELGTHSLKPARNIRTLTWQYKLYEIGNRATKNRKKTRAEIIFKRVEALYRVGYRSKKRWGKNWKFLKRRRWGVTSWADLRIN